LKVTARNRFSRRLGQARWSLHDSMAILMEHRGDPELTTVIAPLQKLILELQALHLSLSWISPSTKTILRHEVMNQGLKDELVKSSQKAQELGLVEVTHE
jgi:hypothetical protein